jgi:prolyl-tRNA synthetase
MVERQKKKGFTPREENFSSWYNEVIRQGGLIDEGVTQGTWAFLPRSASMWNNIRGEMSTQMSDLGVDEIILSTLFPLSLLQKEKEHIEGFAPEVFLVTQAGGKELTCPLVVRPTSEVVVSEYLSRWISSYKDLPMMVNQWGSAFRSEKRPRPFLRTTEFLWQEGYSAHATPEESEQHAKDMAIFYGKFLLEHLSIYGIVGEKSVNERFAGAKNTYTVEAQLGGKALQLATAHDLGDNFATSQNVTYADKAGEIKNVFQTSWGSTTRMIGATVMAHGDDKGLVLPPQIAPEQVTIIPAWRDGSERDSITEYSQHISSAISARSKIAKRGLGETLGVVRYAIEKTGSPLQFIVGQREIESGAISYQIRHSGEKGEIPVGQLDERVKAILTDISGQLLNKSRESQLASIVEVDNRKQMIEVIEDGKMALAGWSGDAEDEKTLKQETGISLRLHPDGYDELRDPVSGKSGRATIFAKAY